MARKKRTYAEPESHNIWQSYSDMMAGLLLTFILIICGALLMLMGVKNSYDESEMALSLREAQLEQEITEKLSYVDLTEQQEEKLAQQQALLDEQQAKLDEQQAQLNLSSALVKTQQDQLKTQQQQLEDLIGVKKDIVESLSAEFSNTDLNISIDEQTGSITLDSNVLFEWGESNLAEDGQKTLAEFLPNYFKVVLSDEYIDYISEIIIEGHTDTDGTYMQNLALSQDRAAEVAYYCLDEDAGIFDEGTLEKIRSLVSVSGKSFSEPILNDDGTINAEQSRRVEIKFRLSDEEMINRMLEVLESSEKQNNNANSN